MHSEASGTTGAPALSQELFVKAALHDCWQKISQHQPVFEVLAEAAEWIRRCLNSQRVRIASRCTLDETLVTLAEAVLANELTEPAANEDSPVEPAELSVRTEGIESERTVEFPLCSGEHTLGLMTVEFAAPPNLAKLLLLERCAEFLTPLLQFRCRMHALARASNQLREISCRSGIPLIELDANLCITHWSATATAAMGWDESNVVGQKPPMIPASSWAVFQRAAMDACLSNVVQATELVCVRRDGTPALFSVTIQQVAASLGETQTISCLWFDRTAKLASRQIEEFRRDYRDLLLNFEFLEYDGPKLLKLLGSAINSDAGEIWQFDEPSWRRIVYWCDSQTPLPALRQSVLTSAGWMIDRAHLELLERVNVVFLPASAVPRHALQRRASDGQPPPNYLLVSVRTEQRSIALLLWGLNLLEPSADWKRTLADLQFELGQQFMIQSLQTRLVQEETRRRVCEPLDLEGLAENEALDDRLLKCPPDHRESTLNLVHDVFSLEIST